MTAIDSKDECKKIPTQIEEEEEEKNLSETIKFQTESFSHVINERN